MFSKTIQAAGGKAARRGASFSVIGPDVVVTGDLATSENLQVGGRIDGDVKCAELHQAETGAIAGNIVADEARLAGRVDGTVTASIVVLEASARVTGEVSYTTLSIAAGARVDGRFEFRGDEPGSGVTSIEFNEIFPHEDTAAN
ncbi:MAG TPA: polymer-forming cytoskeletal protein [Allosphingosinicella sp.]|jgi:cytoskeletal protein CcmA (bactofilin family)